MKGQQASSDQRRDATHNAFGNALGNSIVGAMQPNPTAPTQQQSVNDDGLNHGVGPRYSGPTIGAGMGDLSPVPELNFDDPIDPTYDVKVGKGDTVGGIVGNNYDDSSIDNQIRVAKYNGLTSAHQIRAGQNLSLPDQSVLDGFSVTDADRLAYLQEGSIRQQISAQRAQERAIANSDSGLCSTADSDRAMSLLAAGDYKGIVDLTTASLRANDPFAYAVGYQTTQAPSLTTRALGVLQEINGAAQVAVGTTLTAIGSGAIGVPLAANGADQYVAGVRTTASGIPTEAFLSQGLNALGASPWVDTSIQLVTGALGGAGSIRAATDAVIGRSLFGELRSGTWETSSPAGISAGVGVSGTAPFAPTWRGAGPASGTFGVEPGSPSVAGLQNYYPRQGSIEYIFDPDSNTFVVGSPWEQVGSPHESLAATIGADNSTVVGGIFARGPNGKILTNESSGHFWQNWNPAVRDQFSQFMESMGVPVQHSSGH